MTWEYSNYLDHHGIRGQKWGVRRYQNDDGSLTNQGKQRYESLSPRQKKQYDNLSPQLKRMIDKKMGQGKSYSKAHRETVETSQKLIAGGALIGIPLIGSLGGIGMGKLLTTSIKVAKVAAKKVKNSQAFHNFMNRVKARKTGDIVLSSRDYSIKDIPFGGFLSGIRR